ncbi:hypothetical protein QTO34_002208 [Cnephaeus nilssonii]|uniref:Uncharacterized protein n=1 Tax=Cnephaeus nilssonii TaxID=3371016 RepID=A0AA40LLL6_CNENI|nr:hypothetical protein QTO34_002208 [Eptesicus nilssonii]
MHFLVVMTPGFWPGACADTWLPASDGRVAGCLRQPPRIRLLRGAGGGLNGWIGHPESHPPASRHPIVGIAETQEEKENEEMSFFNAMKSEDSGLAVRGFLPPHTPEAGCPEIGPAGQQPRPIYEGMGNKPGRPATGYYWAHTPFSTSILLNWKNSNLSNRENPQKIGDIFPSIFATHHPYWALLKIQLTADERQEGINKANEEDLSSIKRIAIGYPTQPGQFPWQSPTGTQKLDPSLPRTLQKIHIGSCATEPRWLQAQRGQDEQEWHSTWPGLRLLPGRLPLRTLLHPSGDVGLQTSDSLTALEGVICKLTVPPRQNGGPHSHKMVAPSHLSPTAGVSGLSDQQTEAGEQGMAASSVRQRGSGSFLSAAAGKPQALLTEAGEQGLAVFLSGAAALQSPESRAWRLPQHGSGEAPGSANRAGQQGMGHAQNMAGIGSRLQSAEHGGCLLRQDGGAGEWRR